MKKILFGLTLMAAMASCTEDYKDWASPANNPQEPVKSVEVEVTSAGTINLADAEESVQLFTPSVVVSDEAVSKYTVELYAEAEGARKELTADSEGKVLTADLQDAVVSLCGARPIERSLFMDITCLTNIAGQSIQNVSKNVAIKITPEAPFIDPAGYYVVGNIDGWACTRVDDFHMVNNGGDVYENPEFSVTIAAVAGVDPYEVKFVPSSAFKADGTIENWGIALSALPDVDEIANKGSFSYNNAGGNIKFAAVEGAKFYTIKANLLEGTYEVTPVKFEEYIYVPGNAQKYNTSAPGMPEWGWTPSLAPALRSPNCDGKYEGFAYMDGEFKFTKKRDWDHGEYNYDSFTSYDAIFTGNVGTGGNINCTTAGYYKLVADVANGSLAATKLTWGLVGPATPGEWDAAQYTVMTYNMADDCWEITTDLVANEFKFTTNGSWDINLGGSVDDLSEGGGNLSIAEAGNYTIKLYPSRSTNDKLYCTITKN